MIPQLVEKFKGREEAYYTALAKKYGPLGEPVPVAAEPPPAPDRLGGRRQNTNGSIRSRRASAPSGSSNRRTAAEEVPADDVSAARNDWMSIFGCFGCGVYNSDRPSDAPPDRLQTSYSGEAEGGGSVNARKLQRLEEQLTEARAVAERLAKKTADFELRLAEATKAAEDMERLKEANIMRDVEIAGLFEARTQSEGALQKVMDDVSFLRQQFADLPAATTSGHPGIEDTLAATEQSMRALEAQLGNISSR